MELRWKRGVLGCAVGGLYGGLHWAARSTASPLPYRHAFALHLVGALSVGMAYFAGPMHAILTDGATVKDKNKPRVVQVPTGLGAALAANTLVFMALALLAGALRGPGWAPVLATAWGHLLIPACAAALLVLGLKDDLQSLGWRIKVLAPAPLGALCALWSNGACGGALLRAVAAWPICRWAMGGSAPARLVSWLCRGRPDLALLLFTGAALASFIPNSVNILGGLNALELGNCALLAWVGMVASILRPNHLTAFALPLLAFVLGQCVGAGPACLPPGRALVGNALPYGVGGLLALLLTPQVILRPRFCAVAGALYLVNFALNLPGLLARVRAPRDPVFKGGRLHASPYHTLQNALVWLRPLSERALLGAVLGLQTACALAALYLL